jgi:hypothetical protein
MAYTRKKMQEYLRDYLPKWRERRRQYALAKLGGKCVRCGATKNLDFDHIDPATKVGDIGRMWQKRKDLFEAELLKCQLLCKPCHLEKTRENGDNQKATHGGWSFAFKRKCKCDICMVFRAEANRKRRIYRADRTVTVAASKTAIASSTLASPAISNGSVG